MLPTYKQVKESPSFQDIKSTPLFLKPVEERGRDGMFGTSQRLPSGHYVCKKATTYNGNIYLLIEGIYAVREEWCVFSEFLNEEDV